MCLVIETKTKHGCLMSEKPASQSNSIPRLKKFRWSQRTCSAVGRLAALHPELPENQSIALTLRWLDGVYTRQLTGEFLEQYMAGALTRETLQEALADANKAAAS
jgi:hypothetical protein